MSAVLYQRSVPVRREVDLLVAGGGPAGVAAAVTAARLGAKVFLLEGQSAFGGMGTSGDFPSSAVPRTGKIFSPPVSEKRSTIDCGKAAAPVPGWCAMNTRKRSEVSSTIPRF